MAQRPRTPSPERTTAPPDGIAPWPGFPEPGAPLDRAGRLLFDGWLCHGTTGWVLRAREATTSTARALRLILPELLASGDELPDPGRQRRNPAEADTELVVQPHESGWLEPAAAPDRRWPYLMSPWVEGRSLREVLGSRSHGVLPEQAFHVAGQVARALNTLHREGRVHGRLRPETVMVTTDNRIRLLDAALPPAWRRAGLQRSPASWADPSTVPELAAGDPAGDPREDVYQLGILVYELFSGTPCSPWIVPEPLSEIVDYAPPALDRLIHGAIGHRDARPPDAGVFGQLLLEAEAAFGVNQRENKVRATEKARDTWSQAQELATGAHPPWFVVASLCQRLLGQRPHLLPFGTVPERPVRDLLAEARERLQAARRDHVAALLQHQGVPAAEAAVEGWAPELPAEQRDELRLELAAAKVQQAEAVEQRQGVARSLLTLLREPEAAAATRARAADLLERLFLDTPPAAESPAPAARTVAALSPPDGVPAVDRWWVHDRWWTVVVGPALRLGRGPWQEFGNHVDLRPSREEAAENSYCLALAQTLSRAGHMELRVNGLHLEAACLGTAGITVDRRSLRRGEACPLEERGTCTLADGASMLDYEVFRDTSGAPWAVALEFTAGVGQGRRAAWVLQRLPMQVLLPGQTPAAELVPGPGGWRVAAREPGIAVGTLPVEPGAEQSWAEGVPLTLPGGATISR